MKQFDAYRSKALCDKLVRQIHQIADRPLCFMEVCGGHTMAIRKYGIPSLLPANIRLLSGPGCPVCVTSRQFIDRIIYLARMPETIICTYGDLLRVPGSEGTLEQARAKGCRVQVVWSSLHALKIAEDHPTKTIIFPGIGFETTAPATAAAMARARQQHTANFFVLSAHKTMPPAMDAIISAGIPVNGYICPGHVSAIAGTAMYASIVDKHQVGCVVSGFEPVDLLQTIYMLIRQLVDNDVKVEIQYTRSVRPEGNPRALGLMDEVFEPVDDWWRGLGVLKNSGLKPVARYSDFDAAANFNLPHAEATDPASCMCGEVLKGLKQPPDCPLFQHVCTPANPVGACMVSQEGACQTYYTYTLQ